MTHDADVLVVVPTYNERDNLPVLARSWRTLDTGCSSSTTGRRMGPARSRIASRLRIQGASK